MNAATRVRYRGVAFEWGDSVIIVPPITVDQAQELAADLDKDATIKLGEGEGAQAAFNAAIREREQAAKRVIAAAILRNYPNMSPTEISDFVTKENCAAAYLAAIGRSGQPKVKDPEELASAAAGPTSTGQSSTGA